MKKKANTRLLVAAISMMIAGSLVTSDAMAKKRHKRHHHKGHHSSSTTTREYSSYSSSSSSEVNNKVDALEAQMRAMQDELSALRASNPAAGSADAAKVQELDAWMQEAKAKPTARQQVDNMIFFRGGFARNDTKRNDLLTGNQFAGNALGGGRTNKDGWYVGAGFDFGLTDNVWGMMDNTEVYAELMFEYKNFGAKNFKGAAPGAAAGTVGANPACTLINLAALDSLGGTTPGLAGTANCNGVTVSQLTLTAAPKIKFMKGSAFRPWIIPIGLGIHVISPPSNGVTVLNPGMMFAAGADYEIIKDIHLGGDVRYHLTGRSVDGVNTDGLTAGGYLGIGF